MTIPYGKQSISETDIEAVVAVLRSDYLTQGPVVPRFEQAVADYCGATHALAVNSATSALHIACLALGVGPGDRVWTSPVTFVASANCALYCGAIIDFVDICPKTYNLCPGALETKLIAAQKNGTLPKVVIPVHLTGQPCDMERIHALSEIYGFRIIEDASHAIGGKYQGQPIGNCTFSDISVFSFHPVKIITTAEGGMAITNDKILAGKMALYRSHGITRDPEQFTLQVDEEGRPEVRSQESGVGSQESGVRSQESGVRNQESDSPLPLPPAPSPMPHAPGTTNKSPWASITA
jgi:dTDP-4-amino-4,6-dideoxygalactose transaminase